MDQFVNQQQYIYPHYQTMNTANLAIHPYHQNTMQYTQPTLYSVSVPQSAEFYWNKSKSYNVSVSLMIIVLQQKSTNLSIQQDKCVKNENPKNNPKDPPTEPM